MSDQKALRFNAGKLRFELIPPEWDEEIARVFTEGAKKYAPNNWQKSINTEDHDSFVQDRIGSLRRHLNQLQKGETVDPETGCLHAACIAWNALAIMTYFLRKEVANDVSV